MQTEITNILYESLAKNNYSVNKIELKTQFESHPDYPSVKSITDTLDYFNIDNIAANVPKDALEQLPNFFLAVIEEDSKVSIAQVEQKKQLIKLFNGNGNQKVLKVDKFKTLWNGTLVAIEKNESSINSRTTKINSSKLLFGAVIALVLTQLVLNFSISNLTFSVLTLIGSVLTYFILQEDFGIHNQTTAKLCNSTKSNTSCSDVVGSNSAKVFKYFSLSDMTLTYFLGSILSLTLLGFNSTLYFGLIVLSSPILIYSVYSQAFIVKKWCPLCLGVLAVVVGQLIASSPIINTLSIDYELLGKGLGVYILSLLLWLTIKGVVSDSIKLKTVEADFLKFKRNENLFQTVLNQNEIQIGNELTTRHTISFGNTESKLIIRAVTNPLCEFCSKSFKVYEKLLKTHGAKFRLDLVFNINPDFIKHDSFLITQQLILLYKDSPKQCFLALQDWFLNRDIKQWQNKYGTPEEHSNIETLHQHYNWCTNHNITYTPATIINTKIFPKEYNIEDLPLFIDLLIDNKQEAQISVEI